MLKKLIENNLKKINSLDFDDLFKIATIILFIMVLRNSYKCSMIEGMTNGDDNPVSSQNLTAIRNLGNLVTKINGAISIDSDKNVTFSKNVNVTMSK